MRIGQYDSWNERDNISAVLQNYEKVINLAHSSSMPNEPNDCWRFAKDSLIEFGCSPAQAEQLMSLTKDIRELSECKNLDPNVHVLRAFLGRCAYRARLHLQNQLAYHPAVEEGIKSGIIIIGPDELGLTDEQHKALERELSTPNGALSKNVSNMVALYPNQFPVSNLLLSMLTPILSQISGYSQQTITDQLRQTSFAQRVVNGPEDNDVQKIMHQDTWFDAWKLWYFPRSVLRGEGPFRYAPYSHGLSYARLKLMKEFATHDKKWEAWRSFGHDEGSWRVSDDELMSLGAAPWPWRRQWPARELNDEVISDTGVAAYDIEATAGTVVIANVYGYHARGLANETRERISLHASIRPNPWTI